MPDSVELKFPVAAHHRLICDAVRGDDAATAAAFAGVPGLKMRLSSGGTSRIKSAVLAACRKYLRENHIRGFLDGEHAGDVFSRQFLSFPDTGAIPVACKRSPNPGIVFIAV